MNVIVEDDPLYITLLDGWLAHIKDMDVAEMYQWREQIIDDIIFNISSPHLWPKEIRSYFFDPYLPLSLLRMDKVFAFMYGNNYCPIKYCPILKKH